MFSQGGGGRVKSQLQALCLVCSSDADEVLLALQGQYVLFAIGRIGSFTSQTCTGTRYIHPTH